MRQRLHLRERATYRTHTVSVDWPHVPRIGEDIIHGGYYWTVSAVVWDVEGNEVVVTAER